MQFRYAATSPSLAATQNSIGLYFRTPGQWRGQKFSTGVRQSVAFLFVHSRSAALPSRPYNQKNVMTYHTA